MAKTYVLDTNVLLHNPMAIFCFSGQEVVLPLAVIEEIDNQKRRQDEIGRNARLLSRKVDELRTHGKLSTGVPMPGGGRLRVEVNHQAAIAFPKGLDPEKYDNRILALSHNLKQTVAHPVILVTKDLNLRIKADVMGIAAEDFLDDKVDATEFYAGFREMYLSGDALDVFYRGGEVEWEAGAEREPNPNEFIILKCSENPSRSGLGRYCAGRIRSLFHGEAVSWGIGARNKEQRFAMELLLDDAIRVVTMVGRAGTGKTLLALAAGLEKVIEQNRYQRLLIMRPVVPMGDDLGYLPGSKEEKLRPWMQPIYDNLDFLFRKSTDASGLLEDLMARGTIEMESLTYIRGRSIPNQFILCDEAQNLTPNMIKTLITRVGEGTKLVFTGDPEQIDHPYLDASSNGLAYAVERLKHESLCGHIALTRGERSQVAEMAAALL